MTIKELKNRIYQDFISSFKNAITPLRVSFFDKFSDSLSSTMQLLYIYLNNIKNDSFLTSCTQSRVLSYFAPLKNLTLKKATKATGILKFTGVNGSIIPQGTQVIYSNQLTYITTESGIISSGFIEVTAESEDLGRESNTLSNIDLFLVTPLAGIDNKAISIIGFGGASDNETTESLRTRTKQAFASPSKIDNYYSYVSLAEQLPNVKKAFVSPIKNGVGTFGITMLSVGNNGVPIQSDIDEIELYFKDNNAIPVYVQPEYFLPVITKQDFIILLQDSNDENKQLMSKNIEDYLMIFQRPGTIFYFSGLAAYLQSKGARLISPTQDDSVTTSSDEIIDLGIITWL